MSVDTRLNHREQMPCDRCKRFIGDDCLQGVDWSQGSMQMDGDWPWTEDYFCGYGKGCNAEGQLEEARA